MGTEENGDARRGSWATDQEADMVGEEEEEKEKDGMVVEMSQMSRHHRRRKTNTKETEEGEGGEGSEEKAMSIERAFEGKRVPTWREQLTLRALVVSFFLSVMLSIIVTKLNLTTGIIPSLNVAAGLLGFFFIKTWTKALEKTGLLRLSFTRQENTVIQTCCVAAYSIAYSGKHCIFMARKLQEGKSPTQTFVLGVLNKSGFGAQLFGMSERIAKQASEADNAQNIRDPELGWMIGFLFLVSFPGLFSLVPLRKIMIIDYKLIYPSGTATAFLINGFHTPQGAKQAKKQVRTMGKFFVSSFLWGLFQWFYTGGDDCGFANFPTLGLKAYENTYNA